MIRSELVDVILKIKNMYYLELFNEVLGSITDEQKELFNKNFKSMININNKNVDILNGLVDSIIESEVNRFPQIEEYNEMCKDYHFGVRFPKGYEKEEKERDEINKKFVEKYKYDYYSHPLVKKFLQFENQFVKAIHRNSILESMLKELNSNKNISTFPKGCDCFLKMINNANILYNFKYITNKELKPL